MATATKTASYTIEKSTLESACSLLAPLVPKRTAKPILRNIRLGEGLVVASDLEIQVAIELAGYDGPVLLLPHDRISAILRESRGDDVTLTPGDTKVTVECGRGKWTLPTEDPLEFPSWEPTALKPVARFTREQFRDAIRSVTYAADSDSSRYALSAVLIEVNDGTVSFVATDGRRLSLSSIETDQAVDDSMTMLPDRAAVLASRFVTGEDSVQIEASTSEAVITHGGVTITARLIQGRFPRWRDAIPPDREVAVTKVAKSDLLAATLAAAIVTSEQSKGVDYKFGARCITLSARSAESGESRVECEVLGSGHATIVKLDPHYVVDWLRGLPGDENPEVSISAVDKASAVVFTCETFTGVVMPLDPASE
jgi:DNA polymerase-3 subunit beta